MRTLDVYYNETKAGMLTELNRGTSYTFKYEQEYLSSDLPPISATLSKREDAFESDLLFPFFSNMIPDGANRVVICRTLRIDDMDFFGILSAMADKDFIGAVSIRTSSHDWDKELFLLTSRGIWHIQSKDLQGNSRNFINIA